jgi:hypothetical protein
MRKFVTLKTFFSKYQFHLTKEAFDVDILLGNFNWKKVLFVQSLMIYS